ncbi:hypothetical protein RhiJN_24842 [Ceratobasidium sp. AG-Ba]|nr:hypothetical protein RhiJN_24842 [Ceratobasidium sp. AG-Ba]
MAPICPSKSIKTTGACYNPCQTQAVSVPPKSVFGESHKSQELTWGHGPNRMYSYQDTIRRCNSFMRSKDFPKSLDPSLTLDHIPMAKWWNCRWLASHTIKCPKRGDLYWVGKGPQPNSDKAMQATKLFVIEEWVGSEVEHLVQEVHKVKTMSWYRDYKTTWASNKRLIKELLNSFITPHLISVTTLVCRVFIFYS